MEAVGFGGASNVRGTGLSIKVPKTTECTRNRYVVVK
jgi:hypothetical protein